MPAPTEEELATRKAQAFMFGSTRYEVTDQLDGTATIAEVLSEHPKRVRIIAEGTFNPGGKLVVTGPEAGIIHAADAAVERAKGLQP